MSPNLVNLLLFSLACVALLGSPGPGIAALVSVGRTRGLGAGLWFYGGLQVGLAIAAGVSAAGLFSLIAAAPFAVTAMTAVATLYLGYLAFRIATAPVGTPAPGIDGIASTTTTTALGGFLLGITNPKAYLAFVSLMASYSLVGPDRSADAALKWTICVAVMIVVDIAWLWLGVAMRKVALTERAERLLNLAMAGTIVVTAVIGLK
jgi:threonine/homoserine/homoserine lactone efflux protein